MEFQLALKDKGLASKTVNAVVSVGTVALNWLTDRGDIPSNPAKGLRKFSGKSEERGILTMEEARKLFTVPWLDERARVANRVEMRTVAPATRHKTEAMAEHYAAHKQDEHFRDLSTAVAAAFRTVGVHPA